MFVDNVLGYILLAEKIDLTNQVGGAKATKKFAKTHLIIVHTVGIIAHHVV